MLFNLKIYFLVLLSGLSLEQIESLGKYSSKSISIYDYIYLELSDFKQGDKISLRLTFDSFSDTFNNRDFYIHYCETDSYSNYAICSYSKSKQDSHSYKDYNAKEEDNDSDNSKDDDNDDDYDDDGDDYHYKFSTEYNYQNTYNFNINLSTNNKYLVFYFTNYGGYYGDIYNLKIEHYQGLTLMTVLIILGVIAFGGIIYGCIVCCKKLRYNSGIIDSLL